MSLESNISKNQSAVEALMTKVNHYAALKAICSRDQSTFEMQDLETRDKMARFDKQLASVEADLREELASYVLQASAA